MSALVNKPSKKSLGKSTKSESSSMKAKSGKGSSKSDEKKTSTKADVEGDGDAAAKSKMDKTKKEKGRERERVLELARKADAKAGYGVNAKVEMKKGGEKTEKGTGTGATKSSTTEKNKEGRISELARLADAKAKGEDVEEIVEAKTGNTKTEAAKPSPTGKGRGSRFLELARLTDEKAKAIKASSEKADEDSGTTKPSTKSEGNRGNTMKSTPIRRKSRLPSSPLLEISEPEDDDEEEEEDEEEAVSTNDTLDDEDCKQNEPENNSEEEDDAPLRGFSADSDSSDEEDDDIDKVPIDVGKLPTVAKDDATVKRKLDRANRKPTQERGVLYLGRIPHGFYEEQMKAYFSQFGDVTRLRLSRNKKTGRSKHYAFIEFKSAAVAQIVAETMDNYLLMGHLLKCKVIPKKEVHPELWIGANRRYRKVPADRIERMRHNKPRTGEQKRKVERRLLRRHRQRKRKLEALGINYDLDSVSYSKKPKQTK